MGNLGEVVLGMCWFEAVLWGMTKSKAAHGKPSVDVAAEVSWNNVHWGYSRNQEGYGYIHCHDLTQAKRPVVRTTTRPVCMENKGLVGDGVLSCI